MNKELQQIRSVILRANQLVTESEAARKQDDLSLLCMVLLDMKESLLSFESIQEVPRQSRVAKVGFLYEY
jgi:hypothetical protein